MDPFDYGALLMPGLRERPMSEDEGRMSKDEMTVFLVRVAGISR